MKRIARILPDALGRDEVLRTARAQSILRQWPEIVGKTLASKSQPDRYERGTVWVSVSGSAWAQELRMMTETILRKLNILSGDKETFTAVRFGVRPLVAKEPIIVPFVIEDQPELHDMSMQEIIARRMKKYEDAGSD